MNVHESALFHLHRFFNTSKAGKSAKGYFKAIPTLIKIMPLLLFVVSLSAQTTDYKVVSFQWDPPPENERVTKYRLYYKEASSQEYSDYVEVSGDTNEGLVLDLDTNTNYTAVVTALNTVDEVDLESEPSNEVEFTTKEFYETPTPPENLKITNFVQININV